MRRAASNPNYQGPFGNTLLHGAVISGDLREVRRLLAAGADPRIANRDGKTPLQAAAILGHSKLYGVLAGGSDEHLEHLLDQALEGTFPASDPVAISLTRLGGEVQPRAEAEPVILPIHRRR